MSSFRTTGRAIVGSVMVGVIGLSVGGCAKHYRITDTASGTEYYSKGMKKRTGGAVTFKDGRTDEKVTLQSTSVERIKKREYKDNVRTDGTPRSYTPTAD